MKDVMVDIETLGTTPGCVITQVAAVYFDRDTGEMGDQLLINIPIEQSMAAGFFVEGYTLKWWLGRGEQVTFLDETHDLKIRELLVKFNLFIGDAVNVWSHATFDMPILWAAFKKLSIPSKLHYTAARDIRTLADLAGGGRPKVEGYNKTHNALDDCKYQVQYCAEYFERINNA